MRSLLSALMLLQATVLVSTVTGLFDGQAVQAAPKTSWQFTRNLNQGNKRNHAVLVRRTGRYIVVVRWDDRSANADLSVSDSRRRIANAAVSTPSRPYERVVVELKKGQRYIAQVRMRRGTKVRYRLTIKRLISSSSSSSGGSGSGSTSSGSTSSGSTSSGSSGSGSTSSGSSGSGSTSSGSSGSTSHNAGYLWLDDANRNVKGGGFTSGLGYPRVMFTEPQVTTPPWQRYSKYMAMAVHASGMHSAEAVQAAASVPVHRMFTPTVTLEKNFSSLGDCSHGIGIAFETSSAATGGCGVWAGHFVYSGGSRLSAPMSANATRIQVQDASAFKTGRYVVIYNGSLTAFASAEHAKITAINGNIITLSSRYKSISRSRSVGAWVRLHEDGGRGPESWVYNMSTECPRDSNGNTIAQYMANWLASNGNLTRDLFGTPFSVSVSGFTFDVDTYIDVFTSDSDVNNDLIVDRGISPNGRHWWGEGVDQFYSLLRGRFPGFVMVGGVQLSGGHDTLNGIQIEGFPNGQLWRNSESYDELNSMFSLYLHRMARSPFAPAMVQNVMKFGTALYPTHGSSAYGNGPMRLGLALTAMDAGFFHHENTRAYPDTWYDEYAVVTDRNATDYGRAVAATDLAKTRANTGWLGQPLGTFQRLYDPIDFQASNALFSEKFDSAISGWRTNNVNISISTAQAMDGAASLRISEPLNYVRDRWRARVTGPAVNLQQTQHYTLAFSARSNSDRSIVVRLGSYSEDFEVGPDWRRYVVPFRSEVSGLKEIMIDVGLFKSVVHIDSLYVFNGDANVFRRDFQRGSVIANATPQAITVSTGSGFRRIQGSQDSVNNGAAIAESVTIPAYDALFMLKR